MATLKFIGKRVVLGITGSIAAYKAVRILRGLVQEGAHVRVVMTEAATRFVTPLTFETLSRHPVATDLFGGRQEMLHLTLPEEADAILVAPATANILAKCAVGLADDLLSTMLLNAKCPLIFAPAMDGDMWHHSSLQTNVETLRRRGAVVLEPEEGPLASGRIGKGRLPDENLILSAVEKTLSPTRDWVGQRVLVSAGPTQEAIDPVRFLTNHSSGKMGYALAQAARDRGAEVILVSGPTALPAPIGVQIESVRTAEEMYKSMTAQLPWATVVVMAAAVADLRPARTLSYKLKKDHPESTRLELERTPDILAHLSKTRTSQILVGFAAETEDVLAHAKAKLENKQLDLIVGNNVAAQGSGFGTDTNAAILVSRRGQVTELPLMTKRQLADHVLNAVLALRGPKAGPANRNSMTRR